MRHPSGYVIDNRRGASYWRSDLPHPGEKMRTKTRQPSEAAEEPIAVPPNPHHERRWLALGVILVAQMMLLLDATIVNVALPSVQADLGFSDDTRGWVVTAYLLAFGSLLLLGGRLADAFGSKT